MFDTVFLKITQEDVGGVDFLSELPCFLDNETIGKHDYDGRLVLTGNIGRLKVSISSFQLSIKDGSLCKWYLGDNFQTLTRGDTKRAIEKLSDNLHLPMDKATVTRLDVAKNIITRHPTDVYFEHLGLLKGATRLLQPNSVYYDYNGGKLLFYDKVAEAKNHREKIPPLFVGKNVLRYEMRYMSQLPVRFGVNRVTGAMLYDEAFYVGLAAKWHDKYKEIQKINNSTLNFEAMKSKQDLYRMGVLALAKLSGGQNAMIDRVNEAQKNGTLSRKQAYDIRQAITKACSEKAGLTVANDAIKELDKKIAEAIRYYR